ncbi:MAG: hypothetical protein Q8K38_04575 [Burkholderiaceae bacterium]|nr:hypothetical protein [Burkholderiaceae bacterium]MDZ4146443.1 hypothetical protein [Burkholderiales bacterium]
MIAGTKLAKYMDIFGFLRDRGSPPSESDEGLYEFVASELANSLIRPGLWTRALSESEWNESKAKALYVKMRISQLREERQTEVARSQFSEVLAFGLTNDEIKYLGKPIKAIRYISKYRVSKDSLAQAIVQGRMRGVLCREILWVQDQRIL